MNGGCFYIQKAIISLLILAMINISLDLSYYSFRSSLSKSDSFSEIDVNSVTELVLEMGFEMDDLEANEEEEDQPTKPQKPSIKLVPGIVSTQLFIPDHSAEFVFVPALQNHYTSFYTQDTPPPKV